MTLGGTAATADIALGGTAGSIKATSALGGAATAAGGALLVQLAVALGLLPLPATPTAPLPWLEVPTSGATIGDIRDFIRLLLVLGPVFWSDPYNNYFWYASYVTK